MCVRINFKQIRLDRQLGNNKNVFETIICDNVDKFNRIINKPELERILTDLEVDFTEFWDKCRSDSMFAKLASGRLAKKATRQGCRDELVQLNVCNEIGSKFGVYIKPLGVSSVRPTKDGRILGLSQIKSEKIDISDCLKSFDAKIYGKIRGWVSAKVAYGNGGHQDNVFHEMDQLANWWITFEQKELLVLLIDTDLIHKFDNLKNKYNKTPTGPTSKDCCAFGENVKVFNHYTFQEFLTNQ